MSLDLEKAKKLLPAATSLGSGTVLKAIGKFLPGIGQFVSGAYTAGYAADQILDFVKDKLESPSERRNKQQLESREEQGVARADERANLSQMEQQAAPGNAIAGLGRLGAQALGGMASAKAGAEQQQQENAFKQQELEQQAQSQQQKQQVQEQNQQRQAQQDQLAAVRRQNEDIQRKEALGFKQRAEERSVEKHKASMNRPAMKSALKKKIPETHSDLLNELYAVADRFQ